MYIALLIIAAVAIALEALRLYLSLFGDGIPYIVNHRTDLPVDSLEFRNLAAFLSEAKLLHGNEIEVLTNGPCFYQAELAALASAQNSIHIEAYIFHRGDLPRRFVQVLSERARAGVKVHLTLDYIGSFSTPYSFFQELTAAGGRVQWYHGLHTGVILQLNNRTHRELIVIDGKTAFIGGAGIADWWYRDGVKGARWRDMMIRVTGPSVAAIQAVFAQNWLRVTGEILTSPDYFQFPQDADGTPALVVGSTPAAGSTQARILFQLLISCARKCIYISTPYFLPDHSARQAIIKAARERNVEVKILTPGDNNDQRLTRASSRHLYGSLLKHGIRIYEYSPSMNHTKAMMVDDCWVVVGSTNFDYRSFSINDEVNLALLDAATTRLVARNFDDDLAHSKEITYPEWRNKARFRLADRIFSLLERQE